MPPPEPGPLEGGPSLASGSPYWAISTFGSLTSGGAIMLGSMVSLGFGLLTTAIGGVNCRNEGFGKRPLLAGNNDRSPPPPPPPICCGLGGASGGGARSIGATSGTYCFTLSCTVLLEATVSSRIATTSWKPVDIMNELFLRPYRPQISFTAIGFEVTSRDRKSTR